MLAITKSQPRYIGPTCNPHADAENFLDMEEAAAIYDKQLRADATQEALELGRKPEAWRTGPHIHNRNCVPYDLSEVFFDACNFSEDSDTLEKLQAELFASDHPAAQKLRQIVANHWANEFYF